MLRSSLFTLAFLALTAVPAAAQLVGNDTAPGDSCTDKPIGATRLTADADGDGGSVTLVCDGSIWQAETSGGGGGSETDPTVDPSVKDGVDWTELSGIPLGFADDTDDGITSETDPTVAASVKDGVDWTELSGIPAGFADDTDDGISDWSELSGIPVGFADNTDDGITSETDPTVDPSVKDGVDWTELSGIPAGFADDTDDGITSESDPTVDPSVKDGVDWTELSGIPAGFADDTDNTGALDCVTTSNTCNFSATCSSPACAAGYALIGGGGACIQRGVQQQPQLISSEPSGGQWAVGCTTNDSSAIGICCRIN